MFPADPRAAQYAAQVQLRLGFVDIGLNTLATATSRFPDYQELQYAWAEALTDHGPVATATQVWWDLFDRAETPQQRTRIVERLAQLYQRRDATSDLVADLERLGAETGRQREMTLHTASVWLWTDHITLARQALQALLDQQPQDVELLERLVELCTREENLPGAIDYQRRLLELQPGPRHSSRLFRLLLQRAARLERDGQGTEACRTLARALQVDPSAFSGDFETHLQSFESAGQLPLLAATLLSADVSAFQSNVLAIAWLAAELHSSDGTQKLSAELAATIWRQFPQQRAAVQKLWRARTFSPELID